jgi:NDP-sugar pyrophosphorylase family protein
MIPVAILAGGLGTRLGDLTRDVPKPMIAIAGRPFLAHIIESFAVRGFSDFVLMVGHHSEAIESYFGDGSDLQVAIRYSREAEPLGTGGAVREARALLGERFILTYGDVLRHYDYDRFAAQNEMNCLAVYRHREGMTSIGSGNVDRDLDGFVTTFAKDAGLPWVDAGFAVLDTHVLDVLPDSGVCSFESSVYPKLAIKRELYSEEVDQNFFDIGNPADLARTRARLEHP